MKLSNLGRKIERFKRRAEIEKLKQDQYDLEEEFKEVTTKKERLTQQLNDNAEKQTNLLKVAEKLTEKVTKLNMQPLHTQGLMTSSSQNVSNPFGNLSTSFQVKVDIDIGKFSGSEPTPSDELNFDQWCICGAHASLRVTQSESKHSTASGGEAVWLI